MVFFTVSALGTALAETFFWYNIYRIIGGFGMGIALNLSPMYIAEMSPPKIRGMMVSVNQVTIMVGVLMAQVVNWQISLIDTQMPLSSIPFRDFPQPHSRRRHVDCGHGPLGG